MRSLIQNFFGVMPPSMPSRVTGLLPLIAIVCAIPSVSIASEWIDLARKGNTTEIARLLVDGADPNQVGPDGITALHIAAARGYTEIVAELLRAKANVDQTEFDGDTALINATARGHVEIVRLLLDHGADVTVVSSEGFTALQHSRRGKFSNIRKILTRAGRNPENRPRNSLARQAPTTAGATSSSSTRTTQAPRRPKKYRAGYQNKIAAVIGVNNYKYWPALSGAKPDAQKVAARLATLGFDTVLELYDADATRANILELLGSKLPEIVDENDLVVIFFAGHGETETLGTVNERKRGYIIPVDATVDGVFSTAIPMPKLRELTSRLKAKHVYYAMDSCYSGLGFSRGLSVISPKSDNYIDKVTSLRSVQMVTAGGEGEAAIEIDGQGVFTRSFLAALDGEADANKDGYVTATEIAAYVAPRVTNETAARQSPQSGRLEGEGEIAFQVTNRR